MSEAWRKNGTCGACSFLQSDFGQPPNVYGHCKMYPRNGSRTSNDATCHEFRPLEGFEEKVVLNVRTHVPEGGRRAERRPVEVDSSGARRGSVSDGIIKRRRDGEEREVVPEAARQFFRDAPDDEDEDEGGEETAARPSYPAPAASTWSVPASAPAASQAELTASRNAVAGALEDPGGGVDPVQMEDALLDVVESFGALADVDMSAFGGGMLVLRPGDSSLKPHEIEIDTFFHKVVMIRDRLRVLEQKINANDALSDMEKIELEAPLTRVYTALTSFNTLMRPTSRAWRQRRPTRRPLEDLLRRWAPRDATELGAKWTGGVCRVQPAPGSDEEAHEVAIDLLFDRVCRLKRRFRELESAIKKHKKLSSDDQSTLLDYLAKSYGTLTTFNVLFRHREDWFSSK
ncbi:MAG: hypothetical protein JNJ59_08725 [Deltaproteobacteria bacterium]|nr:hypothetical protein [Deltaproteobacteria bacterium]